jgi:hypothetical protein
METFVLPSIFEKTTLGEEQTVILRMILGENADRELVVETIAFLAKKLIITSMPAEENRLLGLIQDKKQWTKEYLYRVLFRTISENTDVMYLHLDEVVRHVKAKIKTNAKIKNMVSTCGWCILLLLPLIAMKFLSGRISGDSPSE